MPLIFSAILEQLLVGSLLTAECKMADARPVFDRRGRRKWSELPERVRRDRRSRNAFRCFSSPASWSVCSSFPLCSGVGRCSRYSGDGFFLIQGNSNFALKKFAWLRHAWFCEAQCKGGMPRGRLWP